MQPDPITGRGVELVLAGVASLAAAVAMVFVDRGPIDPFPPILFSALGLVSFALAVLDANGSR